MKNTTKVISGIIIVAVVIVAALAFGNSELFQGRLAINPQKITKVPSNCDGTWALALSGKFSAPLSNSPVSLSSGTIGQLLSMVDNGCDLKFNVQFSNAYTPGQGAPQNLTFQCGIIESVDNGSLDCFSPLRYSQYGAIDNRRMGDRITLMMIEGVTNITILRYTDDSNQPVIEPFTSEYGKGQLKVFAKK